jgi:hypothetical protein
MHALLSAMLLAGFTTEGLKATIHADRHMGYVTVDYGGQNFIPDTGSANNSVLKFAATPVNLLTGGFPYHGLWSLEESAIFANGNQVPSPAGSMTIEPSLVGGPFMVSQRSDYYDAVMVSTTSHYSPQGIDERFVFDGYNPAATVRPDGFYAALGARANRLTDWAAFDAAGTLLASGLNVANNGAMTYLPAGTRSVAQYDPLAGNGFLHDRSYDNKIYLDVASQMSGPATKHFELSQSLRFFESPAASWKATAATVPEPAGLLLLGLGALLLLTTRRRR